MNQELLIANFALLASAVNGIPKLRELILQLAVQGKLVPQDPEDEPASTLLEEMRVEKEKLIAEMKIRKRDPLPAFRPEEIPYELPKGWEPVQLGDISMAVQDGTHFSPKMQYENQDGERFLYITSKNIKDYGVEKSTATYIDRQTHEAIYERCNPEFGDLLLIKDGAITGRVTINNLKEEFSILSSVAFVKPFKEYVDSRYLMHYLRSPIGQQKILGRMTGSAMPRIILEKIKKTVVFLPPKREQTKIAEKIDVLMRLCDEVEKMNSEKESRRAKLISSALTHLVEAKEPETFATHWKRIHDNFDLLYDTPETVGELRKAILQLAVQGKLVPQDPNDEPASTLLNRIKTEKDKLIAEKKIRKSEPLPPIKKEEIPYELPNGWEWVRLGEISNSRLGKMLDAAKNKGEYHPYLRNINVQWMRFNLSDVQEMRFERPELDEYKLKNGDILVCEGGEPGRCAIWNNEDEGMMFQKAIHRVRVLGGCEPWYVLYCLLGDSMTNALNKYFTGATIKHLTGQSLAKYVIALPPMSQQSKIVSAITRLLAKCDEMEKTLKVSSLASAQLMEAVVRDVVEA